MLVHEKHTLSVGVGGSKKRHLLGSLAVDDSTTLEEARKLIHLEFDEVDVPEDFRFVYRGAPCPRKQEPYRFAVECKPCLILAVKPVEGKLKVGTKVMVDGTPGTIERIRKSGRVDVTFPSKPPEKDRKLKNVRRGDLTLPNKQEGAGYAWTTQADDDARRLRDEIRRQVLIGRELAAQGLVVQREVEAVHLLGRHQRC